MISLQAEIVETTFSFPKFWAVPGRFRFFYFRFFFLFPNVSRNENILFFIKSFLFGYPKYNIKYKPVFRFQKQKAYGKILGINDLPTIADHAVLPFNNSYYFVFYYSNL